MLVQEFLGSNTRPNNANTQMNGFLFLVASSILTVKEYAYSNAVIEAIIFAQQTDIKNAPTSNSEKIFTLHEGTKVQVLDAVQTWKKIKISDGKIGWILAEDLKLLTIFQEKLTKKIAHNCIFDALKYFHV